MSQKFRIGVSLWLLCISNLVLASDPVSWTLFPASGFPVTEVGQTSAVTYTLTNRLPFAAHITTKMAYTGGNFSTQDACKNVTLAPQGSCTIVVHFSPVKAGPARFKLIYGYHNNRIPLPVLTGTGSGTPASQTVRGTFSEVPPVITLNPLQTPRFYIYYKNTGTAEVTGWAGDALGGNVVSTAPSGIASATVLGNNCGTPGTPKVLQPGEACLVSGQLTPQSAGAFTLSGLFTYNGATQNVSPHVSAQVIAGGGSCSVHGFADLPLPVTGYQYSDYVLRFKFVNNCATAPATLGQVTVTTAFQPESGQSAITTAPPVMDACSGKTLPAQSACYVYASIIPQTWGADMSVSAEVTAGGVTAAPSTTTSVQANDTNTHTVHFINQCPFDVWYGIGNGAGGIFSPDPNLAPGQTSAPKQAYYLPAQVPNQPSSFIDLPIIAYINGAIWPRTGCNNSPDVPMNCQTGECTTLGNSGTCAVSVQPPNPYSKFEFTIQSTPGTDGVYDVSNINGFNVPVEIKGLSQFSPTDPFICSGAGAPIQPAGMPLGSCPWLFFPGSSPGLTATQFTWVTPGPDDGCTADSDCSGGEICGMAWSASPSSPPINRRCGRFIGYNTLTDYAAFSNPINWGSQNLYEHFNLGRLMSQISSRNYGNWNGAPATFSNLVQCQITDNNSDSSCYNNTNTNLPNCCGCVNWNDVSSPARTAVSSTCLNINNDWAATANSSVSVLNAITWLKQACPTAYSYQFDDPSSSFTCIQQNNQPIRTSYEIVFCPGGRSGLPAGAAEGR